MKKEDEAWNKKAGPTKGPAEVRTREFIATDDASRLYPSGHAPHSGVA